MAGDMDSELLLKFIVYFLGYPLALLRMLSRFFGQSLSKQLYTFFHPSVSSSTFPLFYQSMKCRITNNSLSHWECWTNPWFMVHSPSSVKGTAFYDIFFFYRRKTLAVIYTT